MTDLIVGFPTENLQDIENTINTIKKAQFIKVHLFPYSKRLNTLAAKFLDQIDENTKKERKMLLEKLAKKVAFAKREKFIGRKMKVLFESIKDDYFVGSTNNNLLVYVPKCEKISSNDILDVRLIKNMDGYIIGQLCK